MTVRLTEVEAYQGQGEDPGSHAHRGPRTRNAVMFGPAGHLYAYFTYGLHTCANIVCLPPPLAAGVLLRAGEVVAGQALAQQRRGVAVRHRDLARGPARLATALGVALAENGADLLGGVDTDGGDSEGAPGTFTIELSATPVAAARSPRTGVSGAGGSADFPWRSFVVDDPTVSLYRPAVARTRRVTNSRS